MTGTCTPDGPGEHRHQYHQWPGGGLHHQIAAQDVDHRSPGADHHQPGATRLEPAEAQRAPPEREQPNEDGAAQHEQRMGQDTLVIDSTRGRRRHALPDRGHRQANNQRSSGERSRPGIGEWSDAPQFELAESRAELVAHHQADQEQQRKRQDLQVGASDHEHRRPAQRTGRRAAIHTGHEAGDADANACRGNGCRPCHGSAGQKLESPADSRALQNIRSQSVLSHF